MTIIVKNEGESGDIAHPIQLNPRGVKPLDGGWAPCTTDNE